MNPVNEYLIDTYKGDDKIISDYYKIIKNGKLEDLNGIICPLQIDNRQLMAPVDNQRNFQACAAFSAATLIESIYWKETGKLKQLDSLQVYALAKQYDNIRAEDGTYLEYADKAVLDLCKNDPEFEMFKDYKVGMFYNDKTENTILNTKRLIHKYNYLQVGFLIDEGWNDVTDRNYYINQRGRVCGGHAVDICGFSNEGVYVMNQWGSGRNGSPNWGSKGFGLMKWDVYLKELMYGTYFYK